MIKKVMAAAGLGFAGYVLYTAYASDKGISSDSEGGFFNVALGIVEGGFMKVGGMGSALGMGISLAGLGHIKGWEGFRENVYLDAAGKPTIGYGHLIKPTESYKKITIDEATELLMQDLEIAENAVNSLVKVGLSQFQYDSLVSFVFNVGRGNFAKSTLLKLVNAGKVTEVKKEFGKWIYAGGKKLQGLINRRTADAELWAAGSVA
jgi:lysozyme